MQNRYTSDIGDFSKIGLLRAIVQAGTSGLALKFRTTSQHYYMFVVQPWHRETVEQVVDNMLREAWGTHFCLLTPP